MLLGLGSSSGCQHQLSTGKIAQTPGVCPVMWRPELLRESEGYQASMLCYPAENGAQERT